MTNEIGIMQGRLSPPVGGKIQAFPWDSWEEEFERARECSFDFIDWIVEAERWQENPLMTDSGVVRIRKLVAQTGVKVSDVCADYFMEKLLIGHSRNEVNEHLKFFRVLLGRCKQLNIPFVEIPFVDNSAIRNEDEINQAAVTLSQIADYAASCGVTLALETSLNPEMFVKLLTQINHPSVRANYDMGNSTSLGYNPYEEILSYGEFITTVHIKDRILGGGTAPLGKGNTNFNDCFAALAKIRYSGPFILQIARGGDNELEWAKGNLKFVRRYLKKYMEK